MFEDIHEIALTKEESEGIHQGWAVLELNGSQWDAFKEEICNYDDQGKWAYYDLVFSITESSEGSVKKHFFMVDVEQREAFGGEYQYIVGNNAIKVVKREFVSHEWKIARHA